jgi:hypothetical protein
MDEYMLHLALLSVRSTATKVGEEEVPPIYFNFEIIGYKRRNPFAADVPPSM